MKEISAKECISYGWATFKTRGRFFVGVSAIVFLASILVNVPDSLTDRSDSLTVIGLIGSLVSILLGLLISMGKIHFYLRAHDADAKVSDLWYPRPYLSYAVASILSAIVIIIGLILLIVPGIFIGLSLCFTTYLVVDRKMGPIAAMKESIRMTKGNRWNLLLLGALILLINILGALALLVGLLITVPITTLAMVHAYRTLAGVTPDAVVLEQVVTPETTESPEAVVSVPA